MSFEVKIFDRYQRLVNESVIQSSDKIWDGMNIDGSDFYNVKFQIKPFMLWIWFAALLTASGGLLRTFLKK